MLRALNVKHRIDGFEKIAKLFGEFIKIKYTHQ